MVKVFKILALVLAILTVVSPMLGGVGPRAQTGGYGSQSVQTTSSGEAATLGGQFFRVDWTATPPAQGQSTITGYVYNDYGRPAKNVQLQITLVDQNGYSSSSVIRPVRGLVPAEDRAYFQVSVPASPSPYQVTVASFEFLESPGSK